MALALEGARAKNDELRRRVAELERPQSRPEPEPEARTAEISQLEAQGIIREAEQQALEIVSASRAELLRLGEQITILEAKQESVIRKLRQFLDAELEIVRTIELSGARGPGTARPSGAATNKTSDIEEILRSLETP